MTTTGSAFVGSESKELKKNNRRPSLCRVMYEMRDTKLASFDIFDTLLLRPFADPKDLFYILGEKFSEMDFYNLRIRCEREARDIKEEITGIREITIHDIYRRIQYYTDIDAEYGVQTEFETELDLIYPNKYQIYIFNTFINNHIPVVLTSDMYYPVEMLERILKKNGITGYKAIYVSCDKECSKSDGSLFDCLMSDYKDIPINQITHIDDNWGIILKAREKGLKAVHYPKNTSLANKYRPQYMSAMIGSAYKGIVNNFLAADETIYSVPYEYGFTYGGFLILGYCSYIHEVCIQNRIEKVLFMSRDGDIMKQVWDYMYNDIPSEYLLVSRICVARLSAVFWKKMYIECTVDRMSTRKNKLTLGEILDMYGLEFLRDDLQKYRLKPDMVLSVQDNPLIVSMFRDFMEQNIDKARTLCNESNEIYLNYLKAILASVGQKAALVDIGWRGVNGVALSKAIHAIRAELKITNFLVGGRQPVNLPQIRNGEIKCFLFSSEKNYSALEKHKEKTNFYYELLTMSPTASFQYFYHDTGRIKIKCDTVLPANNQMIKEIQRGVLDFVKEYTIRLKKYPEYKCIPEDDVTQVLYNVMCKDEYFKNFFSEISFSPQLGADGETNFGEWI